MPLLAILSATRLASYWCWWVWDCLGSGPWSRRAFASVAHGCRSHEWGICFPHQNLNSSRCCPNSGCPAVLTTSVDTVSWCVEFTAGHRAAGAWRPGAALDDRGQARSFGKEQTEHFATLVSQSLPPIHDVILPSAPSSYMPKSSRLRNSMKHRVQVLGDFREHDRVRSWKDLHTVWTTLDDSGWYSLQMRQWPTLRLDELRQGPGCDQVQVVSPRFCSSTRLAGWCLLRCIGDMAMDQYLYMPCLGEWTSIY